MNTESGNVLVHWIYTMEEWKSFRNWERKRYGWIPYILKFFKRGKFGGLPYVTITVHGVKMNGEWEEFLNKVNKPTRIHLRESGNINLLEIYYRNSKNLKVISLPIPKGHLRKAIEVQEVLSNPI